MRPVSLSIDVLASEYVSEFCSGSCCRCILSTQVFLGRFRCVCIPKAVMFLELLLRIAEEEASAHSDLVYAYMLATDLIHPWL